MKIFLYSSLCLLLTLAICLLASLSRVVAQEKVANKAIVTRSNLLQNIQQLATGDNHTCALTTTGGVKCWGNNSSSQLGTGNTLANNVAVDVIDLSHGITAITAGGFHSCALTSANSVLCWGANVTGTLPEAVSGANGEIVAISAGGFHTCALTSTGGVKCWGSNYKGQLGNGNTHDSNVMVDVMSLSSGVSAISAGGYHTCAITTAGDVLCWGSNESGRLGNASSVDSSVPVAVSGLSSGVSAISAGANHTCALLMAGGVMCWGYNRNGQLGNGSTTGSRVPVSVNGLGSGVIAIGAGGTPISNIGDAHTCALTVAGGVLCWGSGFSGQLGNGNTLDSSVPITVSGLVSGVSAISTGGYNSCALLGATGGAGSVQCWGSNFFGQLGNGRTTTFNSSAPVAVSGLPNGASAISSRGYNDNPSYAHTCVLTTTGAVVCWGFNGSRQLGDGSRIASNVPIQVQGLNNEVSSIGTGADHSCALTATGSALCWGDNNSGQLGNGSTLDSSVPITVSGLYSGITTISAGGEHTCVLTTQGGILCWGQNGNGQLGNGSNVTSPIPVEVSSMSSGANALSTGGNHTCVLTVPDSVKCWGANSFGQLGNGSTVDSNVPVEVSGINSGVSAIAAGNDHTCALLVTGGIVCWGNNNNGQLGNSTNSNSSIAVPVSGLSSGVSAISAGNHHTCALTTTGAVWCWGRNYVGQLGNDSVLASNVPSEVRGLPTGVSAISASSGLTCALTAAGGALCWGDNSFGQLGDDNAWKRTPVDVLVALPVHLPIISR